MGILSLAVITSIAVVQRHASVATIESHGRKAHALAERGIALASHSNTNNADPLLSYRHEEFNEGYRAENTSLSKTFGINVLAEEVRSLLESNEAPLSSHFLYQLLTSEWGMDRGDAQTFLHSMAEWIDPNDQITTLSGWESPNYERAGFTGRPFNRFFKSLNEIELIHGYEALEQANPNWKEYFNIWTQGQIDLASASPEVISLASITDFGRAIDVIGAQSIQAQITGEDGIIGTDDDLPNPNIAQLLDENSNSNTNEILDRYLIESGSPAFSQITSTGWSGSVQITIILSLQSQSNRPTILERTEKLEQITHER